MQIHESTIGKGMQDAKKIKKLSFLLHSSSQVGSPQNIAKALNKKSKSVKSKDESKVD